jgi:hypothetical protein
MACQQKTTKTNVEANDSQKLKAKQSIEKREKNVDA